MKPLSPQEELELKKRRLQQAALNSQHNVNNPPPVTNRTTHLDHLNVSGQAPLFG